MKANMGMADRIIRLLAAVLIAVLYFTDQISGMAAIVLLAVGAIFIVTSMARFCPLYWPFGISTTKKS